MWTIGNYSGSFYHNIISYLFFMPIIFSMDIELLKPKEVDMLLRYPFGKSLRLAKANLLPHIELPGGEIRFDKSEIAKFLTKNGTSKGKNHVHC